ncbi:MULTISPECIES: DNA-binding protein WhiA [unclassified Mycoplasma]|uniref:DNA-binding protein WhiA n=1 Tax=unclassified Mycoplasma TaxID=2683645 RepID=UPI00211CEE9C|nr:MULTISPECIES: DNA-binding protein WhiA [unclassified Mycoplasma]UUM19949.1 DNA-binding protein WhiA [Mycoplasma sp. 1578d]UUM24930.1 DNA-binding protein WhiA [Mycoplasma sp. 3686d]
MKDSFTTQIKKEIITGKKNKDLDPFLLGFLLVFAHLNQPSKEIEVKFTHQEFKKEIIKMLSKLKIPYFQAQNSTKKIMVNTDDSFFNKNLYSIDLLRFQDLSEFFAGVFFAGGTISNIDSKSYFLYLSAQNKQNLMNILQILNLYEFNFKYQFKNKKHTIYVRSIDKIIEFLSAIQAKKAYFKYLDLKIKRDMQNMINRINNLDFANLKKVATSSINYVELINYVYQHNLEHKFNENELVFHRLRLENPGLSLQYIVQILENEHNIFITKAGLNHWNRKLKKIVQEHKELVKENLKSK